MRLKKPTEGFLEPLRGRQVIRSLRTSTGESSPSTRMAPWLTSTGSSHPSPSSPDCPAAQGPIGDIGSCGIWPINNFHLLNHVCYFPCFVVSKKRNLPLSATTGNSCFSPGGLGKWKTKHPNCGCLRVGCQTLFQAVSAAWAKRRRPS